MTGISGAVNAVRGPGGRRRPHRPRIGALADEPDDEAALALAFVVGQLRHGSVCLDLGARTSDPLAHGRPARHGLGAAGRREPDRQRPGCCAWRADVAYLDRYWREECQVRDDLVPGSACRRHLPTRRGSPGWAGALLQGYDEQRAAALAAARAWTTV